LIWHFFEVWFSFLLAFGLGCALGAYLYGGIARSPLAAVQGVVADHVGDIIDEIKARLGIGPDWRPVLQPATERPMPKSARAEPVTPEPLPLPTAPPSWNGEAPGEGGWNDDAEWADDEGRVDTAYAAELKAAAAEGLNEVADDGSMMRPAGLSGPRSGVPDNLQRIWGIGRRNEELLHSLGIFHFGQIAAWTPAELRWIAAHLKFPERIERDDWIGQATILASGGALPQEKHSSR
jgi:predicted flap endonuclease-1-like 5' DNA nuclease